MKRGYYLWDWFGGNNIKFDDDIGFHSLDYARKNGCFRRFAECKKHGIADIKSRIARLDRQLYELEKTELKDVR